MTIKVAHVCYSDTIGGAAKAAYRIHRALQASGADSTLWVERATLGDPSVLGTPGWRGRFLLRLRQFFARIIRTLARIPAEPLRSLSIGRSQLVRRLNNSDVDVVNLHWVQGEMLSVSDVARIRKPIVWTLHDMWTFCGSEHYSSDRRWLEGYSRQNRPRDSIGLDIDRWVWNRKAKCWKTSFEIVTPSSWLADCARDSKLFRGWSVTRIPNPIDTDFWKPFDQISARDFLGLPQDSQLVMFGAVGGVSDHRKGFDLLLDALEIIRKENPLISQRIELVLVGFPVIPLSLAGIDFAQHNLGELRDEFSTRAALVAADLVVVPSRIDNYPNIALEAICCETPVVGFNSGGLGELVKDGVNGFLVEPFDVRELAERILEGITLKTRQTPPGSRRLSIETATENSYSQVATAYLALYRGMLGIRDTADSP